VAKINEWLEKDKLILLEGWARDGLTDEQIAKNIGISRASLYEWKKKEVDIFDALKKGKEVIDFEVENALLKRALGYEYEEETYENGILTKKVKKQVAPDTTAQIFWLKNRKPSNWKDRVETDEDKEAVANASQVIAKIRKVAQEYTDGTNRN
jgi:hypothetical protein